MAKARIEWVIARQENRAWLILTNLEGRDLDYFLKKVFLWCISFQHGRLLCKPINMTSPKIKLIVSSLFFVLLSASCTKQNEKEEPSQKTITTTVIKRSR
jgi:hypothetical protein